ncbi:hypothetical protein BHM03_00058646 [Ensete ventricosum]|nr:hypothetical protein BHM03_00058646 [Ensete ventricosum]
MSLLPTPPHSTLTVTSTIPASTTSLAVPRPAVILPVDLSLPPSLRPYLSMEYVIPFVDLFHGPQGLGNNTGDYKDLVLTLREVYGVPSVVPKVSRVDWLRNAAGLLDPNYWRGTLRPRPVLDWYGAVPSPLAPVNATADRYLERVDEAVAEAKLLLADGNLLRLYADGKISLIGHSAGGWLARLYLEEFGTSNISLLLTLGSPHLYGYESSNRCTDSNLLGVSVTKTCYFSRYIRGAPLVGNSNNLIPVDEEPNGSELIKDNGNKKSLSATPSLRARFIGQGYKQVGIWMFI